MKDSNVLSLLAQRWREGRVGTHEIMSTNGLWALELAASELQAYLAQQPSHLSYDDHAALAARIKALIETDDEDTQDCAIPALDLLRECYVALAQQAQPDHHLRRNPHNNQDWCGSCNSYSCQAQQAQPQACDPATFHAETHVAAGTQQAQPEDSRCALCGKTHFILLPADAACAQQAQPDFTCTSHPCGLVARQAQPECEHGKSDSKP